ncbi:hypothetical protein PAPYR_11424 [Paratrimastix pyriformis]|uniref:Uncharacterized protein n=1 Tax=Paratrimastix pyriformis TaxID=342808 RepID=A0ABQ8U7Z3_9EUKA|nr:hypothetical protein PAPYR_11424 [Paratrimastix pyriformis]
MIEEMSAMKPYSWRSGSAGLISINVGLDGPPTPPAVLEKHYRNHAGIWDLPPDPACNFKLAELLGLRPIRATHRNDLEDGWLGWQSFLDHHRSLMPTAFRFCRDSAHLGMLVVASAHVSDTADPLISVSDLPDGKPATSARTFAFDHVTHVGAAPVLPHAFPKRDLRNMTTPDRGVIAVADLACGNPGPMVGAPWARIGAENAFCPESTPGKFLRGCTPGTRMTLHHHPDRVATSDFENSNFEFGLAETPAPWWGPLGAYRGSIPAGYGTGNSRTRKFLRGCTPGTRMTLHHHPDRVATSDFENSNFEFGVWSTASITTCGNPGPMVGAPWARIGVSSPPVMGRVIAAQNLIGVGSTVPPHPAPWSLFPPSALAPWPLPFGLALNIWLVPWPPRLRARPQPAQPWPVSVCA